MPGTICKCGNIIKTGEIPNPNQWLIISDVQYDSFSGKIDAEDLYREMKVMLLCKNCGRLWVYWDGFGKEPALYSPEKI